MFLMPVMFAEMETGGLCVGDTKSRKRFIWFPKKLNGQWKFLQHAIIISEYCQMERYPYDNYWIDVKWGEMY
jgi:hypothetical protein